MNTESQQRTVFGKHRNITQGGSMRIVKQHQHRIYFLNLFEKKSFHRSYTHRQKYLDNLVWVWAYLVQRQVEGNL